MNKKTLFLLLLPLIISIISLVGLLFVFIGSSVKTFLVIILIVFSFIISLPLSVFFHEGGHLIFGLISGYHFSEFRILNLVFFNNGKKIKFSFEHLNGMVLGQCAMYPPRYNKKKKVKFKLYNAGGLIITYSLVLLSLLMIFLVPNYYVKAIFIPLCVVNLYFALSNSIVTEGGVNDVVNYLKVKKEPEKVNDILYSLEVARNIRLGKSYSAKTSYPIYFSKPIDHIVFPALIFRYYAALEKNDFNLANKYITLVKKNIFSIHFMAHKVTALLEVAYSDLVLEHNITFFKAHFKMIPERDITLLGKIDEAIYDFYKILKEIDETGFSDLEAYINALEDLDSEGESFKARLILLKDALNVMNQEEKE